jgi:osmoprotectant transport system ATP-binding protein
MINRLIEPSGGRIEVDNRNVADVNAVELRRSIGYVFQGIGLFPHMRVEDNVSIVLRLLGWDRGKRRERAHELMSQVELDPDIYSRKYPNELSGGQQQRVGVARALAADPGYLLMDEPFGALDALTRDTLQKELVKLKERLGKTIVFVTHDIVEAMVLSDRVAVMHEGELQQVGTKDEIVSDPATDFVRDLFAKPAERLSAVEEHRE